MLSNKTILLTGSTDGIGKKAAFMLAKSDAILLMHGKNIEKGRKIRNEIIEKTKNTNVFYFNSDFSSFDEIDKLSDDIHKQFSHIDILVNNAGIYESEKIILNNGVEKNFMVNHLAGFTLTIKLLDLLNKSQNARIINVSSMIHANNIDFENLNAEKFYSGDNAYSFSKLCNILFTYELSDILKDENITVNTLHPGVIDTKLLRAGWGVIGSSVNEGANRILYLARSKGLKNVSGRYFINDKAVKSADISYDLAIRKKLWDISLKYANLKQ
ncbi:MAG: SDR family NAD(P)-dependent oxidoreductase [Bacteroidota bacterium]